MFFTASGFACFMLVSNGPMTFRSGDQTFAVMEHDESM